MFKLASRLLPISALLAVRRTNSIILKFRPTAYTGQIWTRIYPSEAWWKEITDNTRQVEPVAATDGLRPAAELDAGWPESMSKRSIIIVVACAVLMILVASPACLFLARWIPRRKLRDPARFENASPEEIRKVCHQALRFPCGCCDDVWIGRFCDHDVYLYLREHGNADSVPLLIRALRKHDRPGADGLMPCTTSHAIEALRNLTGRQFGMEPEKWHDWWKTTGSELPRANFYPRQTIDERLRESFRRLDSATKTPYFTLYLM